MVSFIIVAAEDGAEMGTYLGIQEEPSVHTALVKEARNFVNDAFSDEISGKLSVALAEWIMSEPGFFENPENIDDVVEEIAGYEPGEFSYSLMAIQASNHSESEEPPMFKSGELEW